MDVLINILQLTLPPAAVVITVYLMMKRYYGNEERRQLIELKKMNQATITPLRLQAYERIILYLERISPNNLVMRVYKPDMSARVFASEMTKTVREELDHNLSQQIYVSSQGWELVKNSKEEMIKMVNIASQNIKSDGSGLDLATELLRLESKVDSIPPLQASEYLKAELRKHYA